MYLEKNARNCAGIIRRQMGFNDSLGCYLSPRMGTQRAAIDYTRKPETAVAGTWKQFGIKHAADAASSWGNMIEDIWVELSFGHPRLCIMYPGGIQKVCAVYKPIPTKRTLQITVLWGPSGTGKTTRAWEMGGTPDKCYSKISGEWWCGYEEHETVIIDEVTKNSEWSISKFIKWLDAFPLILNVRHGTRVAVYTKIIITSNHHYRDWFTEGPHRLAADDPNRLALVRRLEHNCTYMGDVYVPPPPGRPSHPGTDRANSEPWRNIGGDPFEESPKPIRPMNMSPEPSDDDMFAL